MPAQPFRWRSDGKRLSKWLTKLWKRLPKRIAKQSLWNCGWPLTLPWKPRALHS